jgi:myxalamid-type polyketide synthase MxaB
MSAQGVGTISPDQGIRALDYLMRVRPTQAAVMPMNWPLFFDRNSVARKSPLLAKMRESVEGFYGASEHKADNIRQVLSATDAEQRHGMLFAWVDKQARAVLGLNREAAVDPERPLQELGLDSLLALKLRSQLSDGSGEALPSTLLFDYPSVSALVSFIEGRFFPQSSPVSAPTSRIEPMDPAIDDVRHLSDAEAQRLVAELSEQVLQSMSASGAPTA